MKGSYRISSQAKIDIDQVGFGQVDMEDPGPFQETNTFSKIEAVVCPVLWEALLEPS